MIGPRRTIHIRSERVWIDGVEVTGRAAEKARAEFEKMKATFDRMHDRMEREFARFDEPPPPTSGTGPATVFERAALYLMERPMPVLLVVISIAAMVAATVAFLLRGDF